MENPSLEVDVESHDSQPQKEKLTFTETLKRAGEGLGLFDDSEDAKPAARKSKKANQEEFNTLVIAVLTLIVSLSIPPAIQPNQSELAVFSNHLSGILIRHLPIAKGFSADALDIIGLFAVLSGWYARVQPEIKAMQKPKEKQPEAIPSGPVDPINDLSPEAGQFLNMAAQKKGVAE